MLPKCSQGFSGQFWRLRGLELDVVCMAPGCRVQAQCFGVAPSWTVIRKRSGKRNREKDPNPRKLSAAAWRTPSAVAACSSCPVLCFHFLFIWLAVVSALDILNHWPFWRWLPPRNEIAKQCQDFILGFPIWARLLSVKQIIPSLRRWPSKTDSIFNIFQTKKMYMVHFRWWV